MVVPGTQDIVFVFLENAEARAVRELGALFVVAPVEGVAEGGHGCCRAR